MPSRRRPRSSKTCFAPPISAPYPHSSTHNSHAFNSHLSHQPSFKSVKHPRTFVFNFPTPTLIAIYGPNSLLMGMADQKSEKHRPSPVTTSTSPSLSHSEQSAGKRKTHHSTEVSRANKRQMDIVKQNINRASRNPSAYETSGKSDASYKHIKPYSKGKKAYPFRRSVRKDILRSASILVTGTRTERRDFVKAVGRGEESITITQLNEAATALLRLRKIREALSLVELWEQKPLSDMLAKFQSVKSYTIMIDVYGRGRQLSRAFSVFYNMSRSGIEPNVVTYNSMITACARNNEANLAYEIFEEMLHKLIRPDKFTFGSLIDSCAKSGQVERAFEISRLMDTHRVVKDQPIYSALMDACGRARQLERAFLVFEQMKRDGVWPNMVTFSVLIGTCANARKPERAFQLFSELKHWGYPTPNVVVYTALIDACAKGGWPDRAEMVMSSMIEKGVEPNEVSYGALMEGWAKAGRLDNAFEIINRMVDKHDVVPNAIVIRSLIDACKRLGQFWRVKKIWSIMVKFNIRPPALYYPALITMATKNGDIDVASAILLHAYARGSLRRVTIKSENPTLHALACSIAYLNHIIVDDMRGEQGRDKYLERLKVVFGSMAMTYEEMDGLGIQRVYEGGLALGYQEYITKRE